MFMPLRCALPAPVRHSERRICDLFGLTIGDASRYAATLGHSSFHEEIPAPHSHLAD